MSMQSETAYNRQSVKVQVIIVLSYHANVHTMSVIAIVISSFVQESFSRVAISRA